LTALLSGGIDSPVATCMMLERGFRISALYMDNTPYADLTELEKAKDIVQLLIEKYPDRITLVSIPFGTTVQEAINKCPDIHLRCVICKRMMLRVASEHCRRTDAKGIITGDSLGQVASQTIENLWTENEASDFPILRPLIGMDKNDIVVMAKDIGTYDLSIKKGTGCTLAPSKPVIRARMKRVAEFEMDIDISSVVSDAVVRASTLI